jgi:hypothetical protein
MCRSRNAAAHLYLTARPTFGLVAWALVIEDADGQQRVEEEGEFYAGVRRTPHEGVRRALRSVPRLLATEIGYSTW